MSDLDAIRRVIVLYAQLLDDGRFDDWGQLFTEDADWRSIPGMYRPGGSNPQPWSARGRTEIVAKVSAVTAEFRKGQARGMHFGGQPVIEIQGDQASAWWDFIIMHITRDSLAATATGRYYSRFVKQSGRWRFTQRVSVQHGAELPPDLTPQPGA